MLLILFSGSAIFIAVLLGHSKCVTPPTRSTAVLLRHGRDILPTRDKSATGNVALRFWVLVLGRSRDERLLSF